MKKRVLAFVMFVCMMVSVIPMTGAFAFSDVTDETPYATAIRKLEEWGMIEGYSDGTYKPENMITRAEFVKMLMSLEKDTGIEYIPNDAVTGFEDVDGQNHWAAKYIKFAVDNKIINGYGNGTFQPENEVTYEEALKMIVCYLGYEVQVKSKAELLNLTLWPDAYIATANELGITKSVSTVESFSAQITRGIVAQIIYNASSVSKSEIPGAQPPITGGGATSGGGSHGGGGGGGGGGGNTIKPNYLEATGTIVATNDIFIDDIEYMKHNGRISSAYMIFKKNNGESILLATNYNAGDAGYTNQIGYRVKLTYKEIDDFNVSYEVVSVATKDTKVVEADAENIYEVKNNVFKYEVKEGTKWVTRSIKYSIPDMQFMYNGRIVRGEDGTTDDMAALMTDQDLKPEVGKVKLIDTDDNGVADYAIIESYMTIVVETCKPETVTPDANDTSSRYKKYTVTDKYIKEGEGETATSKVYEFDDRHLMDEKDNPVSPTISPWDVVYLAQPKDQSKTIIRISSRSTKKTITIREIDTNGYTIVDNTGSTGKAYTTSQYFRDNVWDTIKEDAQESGVKLVLYMDPDEKVAAAQIGEPSYTTGYLVDAAIETQNNELVLRIVTNGNKNKNESQRYAISSSAKVKGQLMKKEEILEKLKENAAPVKDGKPEHMMQNAAMSQPIRFETNGVSKNSNYPLIKNLDIVPVDVNNVFKQDDSEEKGAKKYIVSSSSKGFGGGIYNIELEIPSTATIMLVPNNRTEAKYYQMGSVSSLSKYLTANEYYNVEPYIIQKTDGGEEYGIFVIYNEDTYATPSVNSPVAIVKEIKDQTLDGEPVKAIETVTASTSSGTTPSKTFYAEANELTKAKYYGAGADDPVYEIKKGDVITFGKSLDDKLVKNIQILFDVSERNNVNQQNHLLLKASGAPHIDDESEAYYRVALGKIVSLPDGTTAQSLAGIYVDNDNVAPGFQNISLNAKDKTVYGYDPNDPDSTVGSQDEDKKTLKLLEYATEGDFVFIFQTGSTERFVYIVKNNGTIASIPEGNLPDGDNVGTGDADNGDGELKNDSQLPPDQENETGIPEGQDPTETIPPAEEDGQLPAEEEEIVPEGDGEQDQNSSGEENEPIDQPQEESTQDQETE